MLVAKRARCCASGPRPLLRVPRTRARGLKRIAALFAASHVLLSARAADFHRVFAQTCFVKGRRRVARSKSCVSCNGDARRCVVRFYVVDCSLATASAEFSSVLSLKFTTMETKLAASTIGVGEDTSQRPVAAEMECGASARGAVGRMAAHASGLQDRSPHPSGAPSPGW